MCEFMDLDRSSLGQLSEREPWVLSLAHIHQPQGSSALPEGLDGRALLPWTLQNILAGQTVIITKMSDLPPEAARDRESFGLYGTKSVVVVPLSVGGGPPFGGLTFSVLREDVGLLVEHKEIVGQSLAMKRILAQAEQPARTSSTVLVLGETGTGKELLARAIHKMSVSSDRPLIAVNCAALPPTLIESELFGREKGAYTGAMTKMIGRFEIADGSTLFLDEDRRAPP
jgi:hypothetical protein